jgi:replicative DNA helicase
MDTPRQNLEYAVLGAALSSKYVLHHVINVVSHKNFKDPMTRKAWTVVEKIYAVAPVDMVTFFIEARKMYPEEYQVVNYTANVATNMVASSAHAYYHAFVLLEMDIQEKLFDTLYSIRKHYPRSAQDTQAIMMHLSGKTMDVFSVLDTAMAFYREKEMEGEYQCLAEFEDGLLKRIEIIKQMAQVDHAIEILNAMCEHPNAKQEIVNLLKNGIISLCLSNQLPPNYKINLDSLIS